MLFVNNFSYLTAFFIGFLGSIHCIGMCGSVVVLLSKIHGINNIRFFQIYYNIGRLLSYIILGFFASFFGIILFKIFGNWFIYILKFFSGIFIISFGIYILGISNILYIIEQGGLFVWLRLPHSIKNIGYSKKTPLHIIFFGFIWGNIPCGLVYSVLIWSVSCGSIVKSICLMCFFWLGTFPSMISVAFFASNFRQISNNIVFKIVVSFIIIFFGCYTIFEACYGKCH